MPDRETGRPERGENSDTERLRGAKCKPTFLDLCEIGTVTHMSRTQAE